MDLKPTIIIDNGTRNTRMGYAGNVEPQHTVPTVIAMPTEEAETAANELHDLDYRIGESALTDTSKHRICRPVRNGIIHDWDQMECFWQRCFFEYLRCEPEEHNVILPEQPLNPPKYREYTAEIMFETYGVPGIYFAPQSSLAMAASWASPKVTDNDRCLTGVVVEAGHGMTHVTPMIEGHIGTHVIGNCIKQFPVAGAAITSFIQGLITDRSEPVPAVEAARVAEMVKHTYCYTAPDMVLEFKKYDSRPRLLSHTYEGHHAGQAFHCEIGYERFLGPELFFNPEISGSSFTKSLPQVIDDTIQKCPVVWHERLYKNIVLSGGSTLFKDFGKRLQRDLHIIVNARIREQQQQQRGQSTGTAAQPHISPHGKAVEVKVITNPLQGYGVWFGGSMLGSTPEFRSVVISKEEYDEIGSKVVRRSPIFNASNLHGEQVLLGMVSDL